MSPSSGGREGQGHGCRRSGVRGGRVCLLAHRWPSSHCVLTWQKGPGAPRGPCCKGANPTGEGSALLTQPPPHEVSACECWRATSIRVVVHGHQTSWAGQLRRALPPARLGNPGSHSHFCPEPSVASAMVLKTRSENKNASCSFFHFGDNT